jgi:hypothetical protein
MRGPGHGLAAGPAGLSIGCTVRPRLVEQDERAVGREVRRPSGNMRLGLVVRKVVRGDGILIAVAVIANDQFER